MVFGKHRTAQRLEALQFWNYIVIKYYALAFKSTLKALRFKA